MAVKINLTLSDEDNAELELMCKLNATNKHKMITGLLHDYLAVYFKNRKEKELQEELDQNNSTMKKNWGLDSEVKNKNLITVGRSIVFPPAY